MIKSGEVTRKYKGELRKDKGCFSKSCLCKLILGSTFHLWFKNCSFLGGSWGNFTKGNLCPDFRQRRGGQGTLSVSVYSQLPSAQNNLYIKVAYFGMTHSNPLTISRTLSLCHSFISSPSCFILSSYKHAQIFLITVILPMALPHSFKLILFSKGLPRAGIDLGAEDIVGK